MLGLGLKNSGIMSWTRPLGPEIMVRSNFDTVENVTNGSFSNGITGWSNVEYGDTSATGLATLTDEGGYLRLANATTGTNTDWRSKMVRQLISWVDGKTYEVKFKVRGNYTRTNGLYVRALYQDSHTNDQVGTVNITTDWVEHTLYYTAHSGSLDISFGDAAWYQVENSEYIEIDDVSIKESLSTESHSLGWVRVNSADEGSVISSNELTLSRPSGESQDYGRLQASNGTNNNVLEVGKLYKLVYTISESTGSPNFDFWFTSWFINCTADVGSHTRYFTAKHASFYIRNDVLGSSIKFSSISIKEAL
tara:strand:- start:2958 stop:3878 length:921 start_codon:yes stop_codon:yes gene_type:complete